MSFLYTNDSSVMYTYLLDLKLINDVLKGFTIIQLSLQITMIILKKDHIVSLKEDQLTFLNLNCMLLLEVSLSLKQVINMLGFSDRVNSL